MARENCSSGYPVKFSNSEFCGKWSLKFSDNNAKSFRSPNKSKTSRSTKKENLSAKKDVNIAVYYKKTYPHYKNRNNSLVDLPIIVFDDKTHTALKPKLRKLTNKTENNKPTHIKTKKTVKRKSIISKTKKRRKTKPKIKRKKRTVLSRPKKRRTKI